MMARSTGTGGIRIKACAMVSFTFFTFCNFQLYPHRTGSKDIIGVIAVENFTLRHFFFFVGLRLISAGLT